jgi:hypothetical protein
MFHRRHEANVSAVTPPPRVRTVRLLETDEDLRAAVERARAFERMRAEQGGARVLSYERYLRDRSEGLADVVQIDSGATGA